MCGIWGIVNSHSRKFDYSTFCTLGIANDSRGGDSCGVFIDGYYDYGAKYGEKLFAEHFLNESPFKDIKTSTVAFGHCRKASIGRIDETTAQPVVIKNNDKVEFVVMHNGTIYNYEELAKKYIPDVNITGMTDSQVMTRIFYHVGYDVLSEYNGGAVFAIADYRGEKPKILLFKGASKKDIYSKEIVDERPLYFCVDSNKEELIFSSISSYLFALRPNQIIWDMPSNCLTEFDGKDLVIVKEISRKDSTQKKIIPFIDNFGLYENSDYLFDNYISIDLTNNTYSGKGKKLHGRIILSTCGKLLDKISSKKSESKEIYFWNGVALKDIICFRFLNVLKRYTNLKNKEFDTIFKNLIRFLSIDRIYQDNNHWYEATSSINKVPFTGTLHMLTSTSFSEFVDGERRNTFYGRTGKEAFDSLNNSNSNINFKTIREECKSLMKQLKNG